MFNVFLIFFVGFPLTSGYKKKTAWEKVVVLEHQLPESIPREFPGLSLATSTLNKPDLNVT